jgi:hypothetical protein
MQVWSTDSGAIAKTAGTALDDAKALRTFMTKRAT